MPGHPELAARLVVICGTANVVTDSHALAVYRRPEASPQADPPLAAALPATATEVAAVVAACLHAAVPWSARGAGTDLAAAPAQQAGTVLIVLSRMRRVLAADPGTGTVEAEAGTPLGFIRAALVPGSRTQAPPASVPPLAETVATVGGVLAGRHSGQRSLLGRRLRAVRLNVVLTDGSIAVFDVDTPGYDLVRLFLGSEGAMGIVTSALLHVGAPL